MKDSYLTRMMRTAWATAGTNGEQVNTPEQPQGTGTEGDNPEGGEKKPDVIFTPEQQAVIDGVVNERLGREKAKWKKDEEDKRKRDGMEEGDRLKAEKADLERERDDALRERDEARWQSQIAADVSDADLALMAIKSNPERYVGADGKVKLKTLLEDKPVLKRAKDPTGPGAGGRNGERGDGRDPKRDLGAAIDARRKRSGNS